MSTPKTKIDQNTLGIGTKKFAIYSNNIKYKKKLNSQKPQILAALFSNQTLHKSEPKGE